MATVNPQFEVHVSNDTFKFNAAHFVAYENYRERLHGHNYRVSVRLLGERSPSSGSRAILGPDGYLMDFTNVKKVTKHVCQQLNEHFICPMYSNVLKITTKTVKSVSYIQLECSMDGTQFLFPEQDCVLLPIVHATAEELAIYIFCEIIHQMDASYLLQRNVHTMEITIAEAIGQEAVFRHPIPTDASSSWPLDVREFIMTGTIVPMPCLSLPGIRTESMEPVEDVAPSGVARCNQCHAPCDHGSSLDVFSAQLQRIADAINRGTLLNCPISDQPVTLNDLQQLLVEMKEVDA
jgi:dihydroneopterin triphosphate aldolase (PTPS-III) / 6-pyruvoyltetrahydropterin synthase